MTLKENTRRENEYKKQFERRILLHALIQKAKMLGAEELKRLNELAKYLITKK